MFCNSFSASQDPYMVSEQNNGLNLKLTSGGHNEFCNWATHLFCYEGLISVTRAGLYMKQLVTLLLHCYSFYDIFSL